MRLSSVHLGRERRTGSVYSSINEILPKRLYLGDADAARDKLMLQARGITHILNVAAEIPCYYPYDFEYKHLEFEDGDHRMENAFQDACAFIEGNPDARVFVHCFKGVSRSASVVIYYLMRTQHLSFQEALNAVKEKRPSVNPHIYFWAMLANSAEL